MHWSFGIKVGFGANGSKSDRGELKSPKSARVLRLGAFYGPLDVPMSGGGGEVEGLRLKRLDVKVLLFSP